MRAENPRYPNEFEDRSGRTPDRGQADAGQRTGGRRAEDQRAPGGRQAGAGWRTRWAQGRGQGVRRT